MWDSPTEIDNKKSAPEGLIFRYGPDGIRTHDLCVANAALSQLSYKPVNGVYYTTARGLCQWVWGKITGENSAL